MGKTTEGFMSVDCWLIDTAGSHNIRKLGAVVITEQWLPSENYIETSVQVHDKYCIMLQIVQYMADSAVQTDNKVHGR